MERRTIIGSGPELRIFQELVELRALETEPESRRIEGIAARTGVLSKEIREFHPQFKKPVVFREIIEPKAFENADLTDVVALKNHNMDMILARTLSKTLELFIEPDGSLRYAFDAPDTTSGNDLLVEVKRRDIQHSSYSFATEKDEFEKTIDGKYIRHIMRLGRVFDISPVVNAAFLQTLAEARNMEYMKQILEEYPLVHEHPSARNLLELELKIKKNRFKF